MSTVGKRLLLHSSAISEAYCSCGGDKRSVTMEVPAHCSSYPYLIQCHDCLEAVWRKSSSQVDASLLYHFFQWSMQHEVGQINIQLCIESL